MGIQLEGVIYLVIGWPTLTLLVNRVFSDPIQFPRTTDGYVVKEAGGWRSNSHWRVHCLLNAKQGFSS